MIRILQQVGLEKISQRSGQAKLRNAGGRTVIASMTLPEMALRFVLSDPRVSTTIVGVRTEEHLAENLNAAKAGHLDAQLISELRRLRWDRVPTPWSD